MTLTDVDEPPVFAHATYTPDSIDVSGKAADELTSVLTFVSANPSGIEAEGAADPEGAAVTYSVTAGDTDSKFSFDGNTLKYTGNAAFSGDLTVSAGTATGPAGTATVTVNMTLPLPPVFSNSPLAARNFMDSFPQAVSGNDGTSVQVMVTQVNGVSDAQTIATFGSTAGTFTVTYTATDLAVGLESTATQQVTVGTRLSPVNMNNTGNQLSVDVASIWRDGHNGSYKTSHMIDNNNGTDYSSLRGDEYTGGALWTAADQAAMIAAGLDNSVLSGNTFALPSDLQNNQLQLLGHTSPITVSGTWIHYRFTSQYHFTKMVFKQGGGNTSHHVQSYRIFGRNPAGARPEHDYTTWASGNYGTPVGANEARAHHHTFNTAGDYASAGWVELTYPGYKDGLGKPLAIGHTSFQHETLDCSAGFFQEVLFVATSLRGASSTPLYVYIKELHFHRDAIEDPIS